MKDSPGTKPYFTNNEFVRRERNVQEDGAARGYNRGHEGEHEWTWGWLRRVDDAEQGTAMLVMLLTSRLGEIDPSSLLTTMPEKVGVNLYVLSDVMMDLLCSSMGIAPLMMGAHPQWWNQALLLMRMMTTRG